MTTQYIELKNLVKSPLNVRKTVSKAACDELKASILAHGLMQNLVVTEGKKGEYHVIAGARRLDALKTLQAEGKLAADYVAPCQVVEEEHAEEMSLAENVVRVAMHPADRFEAFNALIQAGQTAEQVATRFGTTLKAVENSMRLARVAPALIQEYRAEKLTFESLAAFAVTDDHVKQLAVYESLNDWQKKRPGDIREQLTEQMLNAKDKLVKFVTLEMYQKAGGTIRTDLFGEDVYLENPELLQALVSEKLKLVEKELEAEGWGWVKVDMARDWEVTSGCRRLEAEPVDVPLELLDKRAAIEAELDAIQKEWDATDEDDDELLDAIRERDSKANERQDEIESQIAAYAKYDPARIQTAGCYAYIGHNGALEIERGLVKREDAKQAAPKSVDTDDNEPAVEKPKGISDSLKRDLEAYRLQAAQAEMAMNPGIAFDLLVFHAACDMLDGHASTGLDVHFRKSYRVPSVESDTLAAKRLDAVEKGLPVAWLEADSEVNRFQAFRQLQDGEKHQILAYCTALTLEPKLAEEGREPTAYDIALAQTGANVADYWRPTKDNFLSRLTSDQLVGIYEVIFGLDFTLHRRKYKKTQLVDELDKAFGDPENQICTDKLKSWLPVGMAFGSMPDPKPAKGKKSKKAA